MMGLIEYIAVVTATSAFAIWCYYEIKNAPDPGDGE